MQTFAAADQMLADERFNDAEALLRALAADPSPRFRSEARFRLGKLRAKLGDELGAADWYRALLDEEPGAAAVRLELARTYAQLGETAAAARELRRAQAGRLPVEVARRVDRISRALRTSAPYALDVSVGLAPDTNINRATSQRTIDAQGVILSVSRDGRAASGIGLSLGAQSFARLPVTASMGLLMEIAGAASLYRSGRYDDIASTLSIGPEIQGDHVRIRPAVVVGRRYFDGDRLYDQTGLAIEIRRGIGRTAQLSASANMSDLIYPGREFLNGRTYNLTVDLERAISSRLYALAGLTASRTGAEDKAYATHAISARFILSHDVGRMTAFGGASYSYLYADAIFALFNHARRDHYLDAQLGASARFLTIGGMVPSMRLQFSRNSSTIPLYDFRRTRFEFALSRQF